MVAYVKADKSSINLKNERVSNTKSYSSKSTTEISIPDTDCYQTNCKRFEKQITRISKAIHHIHSTKNSFSSRIFFVKTVGLILLFCDIVYLNFYLSRTESVLNLTLKRIEKLETELRYSRLTTTILRSDFNFAKDANNKVTNDLISTLSSLIKQKDVSKFEEKNNFDDLFVRQNDNTVSHFVRKSIDEKLDRVDNDLLIFSNEKLPLENEKAEPMSENPKFLTNFDLENSGANEYTKDINGIFDRNTILFPNETVKSVYDGDDGDDHGTRTRREAPTERRGPLAVLLRGIHPEVIIEDGGSLIAPWVADRNGAGDYPFIDFNFKEGNGKIEISGKGLYHIYAQVFYLSANHLNGFSINLQKSSAQEDTEIARCSVDITSKRTSEVSCYTSVIRQLLPGDRIYLVQRERNSRILHGEGYTYFGLVALNSPPKC